MEKATKGTVLFNIGEVKDNYAGFSKFIKAFPKITKYSLQMSFDDSSNS